MNKSVHAEMRQSNTYARARSRAARSRGKEAVRSVSAAAHGGRGSQLLRRRTRRRRGGLLLDGAPAG